MLSLKRMQMFLPRRQKQEMLKPSPPICRKKTELYRDKWAAWAWNVEQEKVNKSTLFQCRSNWIQPPEPPFAKKFLFIIYFRHEKDLRRVKGDIGSTCASYSGIFGVETILTKERKQGILYLFFFFGLKGQSWKSVCVAQMTGETMADV